MGRRCETPLSMSFFHRFPLIVNIERKRFGNTLTAHQFRLAGDDKTESRYPLDTFIGAADKKINTQFLYIQRHSAKAAHSIYNQLLSVHLYDVGYLLQRVQHAGSGFAMYHRYMRNLRIMCQIIVYIADGHLLRFVKGQHIVVDTMILSNISHTVTISSIAQNQQFVTRLNGTSYNGFHTIGSTALQKNGSIFIGLLCSECNEGFAYFLYDMHIIICIPCTPIGEHGFFYGFGSSKRSGSQ